MINVGQALLIAYDLEIYEQSLDSPCIVKSSNMCQELGLVSNVFSDKTGTLTRNEMKLVSFIVDNIKYNLENCSETDFVYAEDSAIYSFLKCMSLCHTIVKEKNGKYRAESPDELALVEGVSKFDCGLIERQANSMKVKLLGIDHQFNILAVNAFNADRKRMSILVHDPTNDDYYLMCKGADSIMVRLYYNIII